MKKIGETFMILGILLAIKSCAIATAGASKWPFIIGIGMIIFGVIYKYYFQKKEAL